MAEIILGCDKNKVKSDKEHQKTIANMLEKQGHTVKIMSVGPGALQNEMKKKTSKGKIAVFLVNGADLQTYKDVWYGMRPGGYYHTKYCYFGLQGYINKRTCTCEGAKKVKLKKAHDDHSSKSFTKDIVGMTTAEVMEKYKSRIAYACGSTVKELGENLIKVMGGETTDSNSSNKESTGSSIKEALKQAVAAWDGEVEIRLVGDTVYVNRIPNPTDTKLEITEYDNTLQDNVTVTDVNKNTINDLSLNYKDYILNINDPILIKRFGKISKTINATKTVKTLKDAKSYIHREWKKLMRDNGRSVECKLTGSSKWQTGRWVRVYLPSYFIDGYMYITKCSHETDSSNNWNTNVTLVDYPPGFGEANTQNTDSKNSNSKKDSKSKKTKKSTKTNSKSQKNTKQTSVAKKGTVKKKSSKSNK